MWKISFSSNYSAAAQNIKMGWFRCLYNGHPGDNLMMLIIYVNYVNYAHSVNVNNEHDICQETV